jgi:hypothetical protein
MPRVLGMMEKVCRRGRPFLLHSPPYFYGGCRRQLHGVPASVYPLCSAAWFIALEVRETPET